MKEKHCYKNCTIFSDTTARPLLKLDSTCHLQFVRDECIRSCEDVRRRGAEYSYRLLALLCSCFAGGLETLKLQRGKLGIMEFVDFQHTCFVNPCCSDDELPQLYEMIHH